MTPTFFERQQLAKEFYLDVERMRQCLEAAGHNVKVDRVVWAWADYSSDVCATWLSLPDIGSEPDLLAILLKYLPSKSSADDEGNVFLPELWMPGTEAATGWSKYRLSC